MLPRAEGGAVSVDLTSLNHMQGGCGLGTQLLSGAGSSPMAILRTDAADARSAKQATLVLLNTEVDRPRTIDPAAILMAIDGCFEPFTDRAGQVLRPGSSLSLTPGELLAFRAAATPKPVPRRTLDADAARRFASGARVAIEAPSPSVDDGSFQPSGWWARW